MDILSKNVKVYPTAYRGKVTVDGKSYVFNPDSRFNTEANVVRQYQLLVTALSEFKQQKGSFVVTENFSTVTPVFEFVLGGYYFKLSDANHIFTNTSLEYYAHIYLKNKGAVDDGTNTAFEAVSLSSVTGDEDKLDATTENSAESIFNGLIIDNQAFNAKTGYTSLSLKLLDKNLTIPKESILKFRTCDVAGGNVDGKILALDEYLNTKKIESNTDLNLSADGVIELKNKQGKEKIVVDNVNGAVKLNASMGIQAFIQDEPLLVGSSDNFQIDSTKTTVNDLKAKNIVVTDSGTIKAEKIEGNLTGDVVGTAEKAVKDENGNNIYNSYVRKIGNNDDEINIYSLNVDEGVTTYLLRIWQESLSRCYKTEETMQTSSPSTVEEKGLLIAGNSIKAIEGQSNNKTSTTDILYYYQNPDYTTKPKGITGIHLGDPNKELVFHSTSRPSYTSDINKSVSSQQPLALYSDVTKVENKLSADISTIKDKNIFHGHVDCIISKTNATKGFLSTAFNFSDGSYSMLIIELLDSSGVVHLSYVPRALLQSYYLSKTAFRAGDSYDAYLTIQPYNQSNDDNQTIKRGFDITYTSAKISYVTFYVM